MKRSGVLQRRKRLQRKSGLNRRRDAAWRKSARERGDFGKRPSPEDFGAEQGRRLTRSERIELAIATRRWFRTAVLEAAGYECQRCGSLFDLEAHHFLPKSRGGEDDPANGICLCHSCHRGVHDHTVDDWDRWIDSRRRRAA